MVYTSLFRKFSLFLLLFCSPVQPFLLDGVDRMNRQGHVWVLQSLPHLNEASVWSEKAEPHSENFACLLEKTSDFSRRDFLLGAAASSALVSRPCRSLAKERGTDLTGRIALITGGDRGMGRESAVQLARLGATVVIACQDETSGQSAVETIRTLSGRDGCTSLPLDLRSMASVKECARLFRARHQDLHILINSVAPSVPFDGPLQANSHDDDDDATAAGRRDEQMWVSHLGHFALTALLLDKLRRTPGGSRLVLVACPEETLAGSNPDISGLRRISLQPSDVPCGGDAPTAEPFSMSKLCPVVCTTELQRRLDAAGVLAVSGGSCGGMGFGDFSALSFAPPALSSSYSDASIESASETLVRLASAPALPEGGRGGVFGHKGRLLTHGPLVEKLGDVSLARRIWKQSEAATGITFPLSEAQNNQNAGKDPTLAKVKSDGELRVDYFVGDSPKSATFHN